MSEPTRAAQEAGALLREARLKQNLHIAALAASIKVAPAKLEALEAGRCDELPDATFARALAQSVCRVLKIDAQPVLALLPSGAAAALEKVDAGLNTPFRERQNRAAPAEWLLPRQPAVWGVVLLLLGAAAAFVLMPGNWIGRLAPPGSETPGDGVRTETVTTTGTTTAVPVPGDVAPATPASAAAVPRPPSAAPLDAPAASMPAPVTAVAGASAPAPAAAGGAQLTAREATWVHASDATGQVLLSRTLRAGEVVELTGARPFRVRIGNVQGTELRDRGQPVDLASRTRDNVLNLELP